jgi:RNA polymerase sigma factor (sigma-70 family)
MSYAYARLQRMARRIKRGFSVLEDTTDVQHEAMIRLMKALEEVEPKDLRHFLNLSALKIRQTLYDMARRPRQPAQLGNMTAGTQTEVGPGIAAPGTTTLDPGQLALWTELHEQIEQLPPDVREVVDLVWYHEMDQASAAELLGVDERTIRRRWREAKMFLGERLPFEG